MGDDARPGPLLPAAHRVLLLPLLRPARGLPAAGGRGPVGRGRVPRPPLRRVPAAVRLVRPGPALGRPLQGRRAALAARGGGPAPLPPGRVPPARLRPRPHAERGRLLPPRVPPRAPRLPRRGGPRRPAGPRGLPRGGAPARAAQDAGPPLPHQLPLRRDHERVQLQVHVVPRRDHGPPPRLHEEGARLPHLRRDRGEEVVARPHLPGEAAPDGRAHAPPGPARDRRPRGERSASASSSTRTAG